MSTSVDSVKKVSSHSSANNSSSASSSSGSDQGSVFAGKNEVGKANNTKIFKELDSATQGIIAKTIGDDAWVNPAKIAKNLNAAGVKATVGKSQNATYLEITNKDGSKSKIWDVGSDGGIGTQDIDLNGQLKNLSNDIKSNASSSASADGVSASASSNKTYSFNDGSNLNNSASSNNSDDSSNSTSSSSNSDSSSDYNKQYETLKAELKKQNEYKEYTDTQIDAVIREILAK